MVLLLFLLGGVLGCQSERQPEDLSKTSTGSATPQTPPEDPETGSRPTVLEATVTEVTDGDTVKVSLKGKPEKVRLIGIDTPETKDPSEPVEPYGQEASDFTTRELSGKKVFLELDVEERDKYGRLLAYVWIEEPSSDKGPDVRALMFNAKLLLEGYAQLLTIPPDVKYVDYFTKFQTEAREDSRGLWRLSPTSQEPSPDQQNTEAYYIASAKSDKFHRPDCRYVKQIKPENRVEYQSRNKALSAGKTPCSVCKP
ncbi:MAG: thermonuclease family protein [Candidatus Aquicultorales bacterium]